MSLLPAYVVRREIMFHKCVFVWGGGIPVSLVPGLWFQVLSQWGGEGRDIPVLWSLIPSCEGRGVPWSGLTFPHPFSPSQDHGTPLTVRTGGWGGTPCPLHLPCPTPSPPMRTGYPTGSTALAVSHKRTFLLTNNFISVIGLIMVL